MLRRTSSRLHAENDHGAAGIANHSPYRLCTFGFETAAPREGDQVARVASGELEDGGAGLPLREHEADLLDVRRMAERPARVREIPATTRAIRVAAGRGSAAQRMSPARWAARRPALQREARQGRRRPARRGRPLGRSPRRWSGSRRAAAPAGVEPRDVGRGSKARGQRGTAPSAARLQARFRTDTTGRPAAQGRTSQ